jgi:hypothetical protein
VTSEALRQKFQTAMFDIYRRAKSEANYNATIFLSMLNDRGGLATAKSLINAKDESAGFAALFLAGRLDLTVEAMVVEDPRWHSLFLPEEIVRAKTRLERHNYQPKEAK